MVMGYCDVGAPLQCPHGALSALEECGASVVCLFFFCALLESVALHYDWWTDFDRADFYWSDFECWWTWTNVMDVFQMDGFLWVGFGFVGFPLVDHFSIGRLPIGYISIGRVAIGQISIGYASTGRIRLIGLRLV